eukprot:m.220690 g.220690  ORF g.220690 m.220690 type:complete len:430 (-) comp31318_c0_seq1:103-1392(-)
MPEPARALGRDQHNMSGSLADFHDAGFCVVRGALDDDTVRGFVQQVDAELRLAEGTVADSERTVQALALDDPQTWPSGGQRRVVECAPLGQGAHWKALSTSPRLVHALDTLLGHGAWEIETNTRDSPIRFFYAPVVFPEASANDRCDTKPHHRKQGDVNRTAPSGSGQDACGTVTPSPHADAPPPPAPRLVELMSWREERKTFGAGPAQRVPPQRWQPVNRRRFRGKGWHIDVGPGFDGSAVRSLQGHPFQGVVLLLVLSDWDVGGGGTCMVHGSHKWVHDQMVAAGPEGISHDDLNRWCVDHMIQRARDQTLRLDETGPLGAHIREGVDVDTTVPCEVDSDAPDDGAGVRGDNTTSGTQGSPADLPCAVQIVAKAGDVVIMHPLIIHSGTTNLSDAPRIMANGMARIRQDVFDTKGHPLFPPNHGPSP